MAPGQGRLMVFLCARLSGWTVYWKHPGATIAVPHGGAFLDYETARRIMADLMIWDAEEQAILTTYLRVHPEAAVTAYQQCYQNAPELAVEYFLAGARAAEDHELDMMMGIDRTLREAE